jgi:predicted membrane channel-forming protein YqfA (hemolysin III family)
MRRPTCGVICLEPGACLFACLTGCRCGVLCLSARANTCIVRQWCYSVAVQQFCVGPAPSSIPCAVAVLELYQLTAKLDLYTGINLMILTSFFPVLVNLFFYHRRLAFIYSAAITGPVAFAIYVSWDQRFSLPTPRCTRMRALLLVMLGLFGSVPIPHAAFLHGSEHTWPVIWPLLLMGLFYTLGVLIYSFHFPEVFCKPGHCNTGCHSHAMFHVCVLVAASVHYHAADKLFLCRAANGPCK